jgi:dolichol-phosphate mannosyltransferase
MSAIGFLSAILGIGYAALIIWAWTFHRTPFEGWAPIMVAVLVIGGMIMLMLGVLGEYLWRLHDDVRAKPLFLVAETRARETPPQP